MLNLRLEKGHIVVGGRIPISIRLRDASDMIGLSSWTNKTSSGGNRCYAPTSFHSIANW